MLLTFHTKIVSQNLSGKIIGNLSPLDGLVNSILDVDKIQIGLNKKIDLFQQEEQKDNNTPAIKQLLSEFKYVEELLPARLMYELVNVRRYISNNKMYESNTS